MESNDNRYETGNPNSPSLVASQYDSSRDATRKRSLSPANNPPSKKILREPPPLMDSQRSVDGDDGEGHIPEHWEYSQSEPKEISQRSEISCPILSVTEASDLLRQGEVVAFPTETVFGLGADATNETAVKKIFEAKGRPSDNPLIVHVASLDQVTFVEEITDLHRALSDAFWPGPLSIVFKHRQGICDRVRAGLDTVAIRIPSHPVALELLNTCKLPIAAPSANISTKPSPTKTEHVIHDLGGRIAGVVHGQSCDVGVESTVIQVLQEEGQEPEIVILRPGKITKSMLQTIVPNVRLDAGLISVKETPRAPGMKYRHYAPSAPCACVRGDDDFFYKTACAVLESHSRIGVMITEENVHRADLEANPQIIVVLLGSRNNIEQICQNIFDCLRQLDGNKEITQIFSETFPTEGVGYAAMNRLLKASSNHVISQGWVPEMLV